MTKFHVAVASEEFLYVWQYRSLIPANTFRNSLGNRITCVSFIQTNCDTTGNSFMGATLLRKDGKEKTLHIDDTSSEGGKVDFKKTNAYFILFITFVNECCSAAQDPICCITASEKYVLVARESGAVHRFSLPEIKLDGKYVLKCRPQQLSLNCNSTRLAIIDINGVLTFMDMEAKQAFTGTKVKKNSSCQFSLNQ